MGLTFIALQGFDLISAVAGEIKDPERTIPRAMMLSLGAALLIYIPLLLIVSTVGTPDGSSVTAMSQKDPETVMARAAHLFMGPAGYWLVMVAALLSTLSALQANMLAASRIAHSMAEDRTLPAVLAQTHPRLHTPHMAIYASGLTLVALLLAVPDLAAAGSAASLIFLIAFALAHGTAILARKRGEDRLSRNPSSAPVALSMMLEAPTRPPFEAPFFPLIPVVGGIACAAMAAFQAIAEPAAGGIALVWLGLGGLLYVALFSDRAETWVTVIPASESQENEALTHRKLLTIARDNVYGDPILRVVRSDDPIAALAEVAKEHELLVLGMHRGQDGKRLIGAFNTALLSATNVAALLIGGAGRG